MTPWAEYVTDRMFNNSLKYYYKLCGNTRVTLKSDKTGFIGKRRGTICWETVGYSLFWPMLYMWQVLWRDWDTCCLTSRWCSCIRDTGTRAVSTLAASSLISSATSRNASRNWSSCLRSVQLLCSIVSPRLISFTFGIGNPAWGRGTPFPPLLLPCPFTSLCFALNYLFPFSFSHPLYLFSSTVHPILFYQNSPTPFPGVRS